MGPGASAFSQLESGVRSPLESGQKAVGETVSSESVGSFRRLVEEV